MQKFLIITALLVFPSSVFAFDQTIYTGYGVSILNSYDVGYPQNVYQYFVPNVNVTNGSVSLTVLLSRAGTGGYGTTNAVITNDQPGQPDGTIYSSNETYSDNSFPANCGSGFYTFTFSNVTLTQNKTYWVGLSSTGTSTVASPEVCGGSSGVYGQSGKTPSTGYTVNVNPISSWNSTIGINVGSGSGIGTSTNLSNDGSSLIFALGIMIFLGALLYFKDIFKIERYD